MERDPLLRTDLRLSYVSLRKSMKMGTEKCISEKSILNEKNVSLSTALAEIWRLVKERIRSGKMFSQVETRAVQRIYNVVVGPVESTLMSCSTPALPSDFTHRPLNSPRSPRLRSKGDSIDSLASATRRRTFTRAVPGSLASLRRYFDDDVSIGQSPESPYMDSPKVFLSPETQKNVLETISKLGKIPINEINNRYDDIESSLASLMKVQECRIWTSSGTSTLLTRGGSVSNEVQDSESGLTAVSYSMRLLRVVTTGGKLRGVSDDDPLEDDAASVLAAPMLMDNQVVGIAELRNKQESPSFTSNEIAMFQSILAFVVVLLKNATLFSMGRLLHTKAEAMLSITAKLASANLKQNVLIPEIMGAAKNLTKADKCSLFVVDEASKELVAHFQGKKTKVRIPLGSGIAGLVATTRKPINIADAYSHPMFNPSVDKATGYRTETILCMPVTYEDSIVAVAQLINKMDPSGRAVPFTREDEEIFQTFALFAGVSLRNCKEHERLQHSNYVMGTVMSAATRLAEAMGKSDEVFSTVIYGAKKLSNADRCSLFLVDKERYELYSSASDSDKSIRFKIGKGIAGNVALTGKHENIVDAYADPRFNPAFDKQMGYVTRTMLCFPVFSNVHGKSEIVAVSQLINKLDEHTGEVVPFTAQDVENASQFATFAGIGIMNNRTFQHALAARNDAMNLISKKEKPMAAGKTFNIDQYSIDLVLESNVEESELNVSRSNAFNIHSYKNDHNAPNLVRIIIDLFEERGYLKKFKVPREVMCKFVLAVRLLYRNIPYHNFLHAADVCQTCYCYLRYGGLEDILDDLNGFVLMVVALVHDVDHMGLNNSFHFKAETPMGILSNSTGSTSVLEVHHCNLTIDILSDPGCNILKGLSAHDRKHAIKLIIDCILATDMAKHKELMEFGAKLFENGIDASDHEHTKTVMQLILKGADISNVTKPFDISRRWAIAVTEEFFQQGDKEREMGQDVNPMFDRASNKALADGQVTFIKFVGKPYFELLQSILPRFQYWKDVAQNNEGMEDVALHIAMLGLAPHESDAVLRAGYRYSSDFAGVTIEQLCADTGISPDSASVLLGHLDNEVACEQFRMPQGKQYIVTGSRSLDAALGGGIELGKVTEVVGHPGAGKTQLAMQLSIITCLPEEVGGLNSAVIYIDTEGSLLPGRCEVICSHFLSGCAGTRATTDEVLSKMSVMRALDTTQLVAAIHTLGASSLKCYKLICIDSIAFTFRQDRSDYAQRAQLLSWVIMKLRSIAAAQQVAILVVNQVTTKQDMTLVPALGNIWSHACEKRVTLTVQDGGRRAARVGGSDIRPSECHFMIGDGGIRDC